METYQSAVEKMLYILLVVEIFVEAVSLIFLYVTIQNIKSQTKQIENYDKCIVEVFTKPGGADLFIRNINSCSLEHN